MNAYLKSECPKSESNDETSLNLIIQSVYKSKRGRSGFQVHVDEH